MLLVYLTFFYLNSFVQKAPMIFFYTRQPSSNWENLKPTQKGKELSKGNDSADKLFRLYLMIGSSVSLMTVSACPQLSMSAAPSLRRSWHQGGIFAKKTS